MDASPSRRPSAQTLPLLRRLDRFEVALCQPINQLVHRPAIRGMFVIVSRLGDGLVWYVLMIALPLAFGNAGLVVTAQMAFGGVIGLVTYKMLKSRLIRERPFASHPSILCATAPLDQYSFPSGHTLHAVLFGTLILSTFPNLFPLLTPFVLLIAMSRVILGLHYPSDVVVGGIIGFSIAQLTLSLPSLSPFAPAG